MVINYTEIKSAITPINREHVQAFLSDIEKAGGFKLEKCDMESYAGSDFCLIYIMTGGTEGIFLKNLEIFTSKPCYILTSGESNSLAASMEILSYLKNRGYQGEILHGSPKRIADRINSLCRTSQTLKKLNGAKVGTIGGSSDWLIDSEPDAEAYKNILGIEIVNIPMDELVSEIKKGGYIQNQWTEHLLSLGYEKVLLMQTPTNMVVSDIIDTYVYRLSLGAASPQYSLGSAVGLFNGVIGLILVSGANFLSKRLTGNSVY